MLKFDNCEGFRQCLQRRGTFHLDHVQVTIGACALLAEKWGSPFWVTKARVLNWGANEPVDDVGTAHEVLKVAIQPLECTPTIGIAILRSTDHTMGAIQTNTSYTAVDGLAHERNEFRPLAKSAQKKFQGLDFPKTSLNFHNPWQQTDVDSCGYHFLHYVHHALFISKADDFTDYCAPAKEELGKVWSNMATVLDEMVGRHFNIHFDIPVPEVASGVETRMI